MIYLTNDVLDQAVYFDLRKQQPHRRSGGMEQLYYGLLGNGVSEVAVTVRSWRGSLEMAFGKGDLFSFVEEKSIRRMLGTVVEELALH